MSRAVVLTNDQAKTLMTLNANGAMSASDFDRSFLEQLVSRGMAIKHSNGTSATYSIAGYGKTILKSLGVA